MLRVLLQNRPNCLTTPGGDTVQMEWTADFLRNLGHRVSVSLDPNPDLSRFDVVHLFNLTLPWATLAQAQNARRQRKPYILNSIFWDLDSAIPWWVYPFPRNLARSSRSIWRMYQWCEYRLKKGTEFEVCRNLGLRSRRRVQEWILRHSRLVIANSEAEKKVLLSEFPGLPEPRIRIVPSGGHPFTPRSTPPEFEWDLLCAGAIGPRKNQLGLVKALRWLDARLLILGEAPSGYRSYLSAVRREAAGHQVEFWGRVPHSQIQDFYDRARVYVQPSFIETPGVACLEAALLGLPLVVSDVEPVREYFGALAEYCDPQSPENIAAACRRALAQAEHGREPRPELAWPAALSPLAGIYATIEADKNS